ncbi:cellulose binding domain-containing protein [Dactylosporangium aurantiacum]|uniref:Cellulose binding domain-containing protein n=1 Tax=Dactylosporangium aurantiacum TaxID=35754 RepID=A0A9Q9IAW5_9ACTN|nr:cellulose binding domain-containing protein [Dactylosporangium aurantiacum]MDG6101522.1 cellulose binding domain-containing protein [Dactylosporangium aurantiacum]UWZ52637.1 cellulose binding domain-containing protein [Dactylosporangium aurantiacum]
MRTLLALLTAAVVGAALLLTLPAGPAAAAAVRIMPLGDSITGNPGCWRALLWNDLQSGGHTNIDFVGTQPPQGCAVPYDGDGEGHGGALVTAVADQNQLPAWLSATHPDVVLMHFGTNDVWSNRSVDTILAAYGKLVDQMRASNPAMRILVAQIIPMNPSSCAECAQRVVALNAAIPGWAASRTTAASPVTVVDQWTGFSTATDTGDGVHPNATGDRKIADRWLPAVVRALDGVSPSASPSRSASPSPSRSMSPSASVSPSRSALPSDSVPPVPGCAATYTVIGQWPGGFQGEITVRNTGSAPTTGWTARWTYTAGEQITQSWGATVTQSGTTATAGNATWNGALAPGATAAYGFIGTGTPGTPPVTCTTR